jgi:putative heme iron utilization protein
MAKKAKKDANILSLPKPPAKEEVEKKQELRLQLSKLEKAQNERLQKGQKEFTQFLKDENHKVIAFIAREDMGKLVHEFLMNNEKGHHEVMVHILPIN